MSEEVSVSLKIMPYATDQIAAFAKSNYSVVEKLANNFIDPVNRQYLVQHLQGKYKPSWILPLKNTSPMRAAMAAEYKKLSCYHYHFGYPRYNLGKDIAYPGDVSEGIIHTLFHASETKQEHVLFFIHEHHPNPFQVPIDVLMSSATQ